MTSYTKPSAAQKQANIPRPRNMAGYWAANLRLIASLLLIWLAVTCLPILFANPLNQIAIAAGFPLGYFMAAQGSPIVFISLIFCYTRRMERIDHHYGIDQE